MEVENDTKYDKNKARFISNEIFVIYRDEEILSHKKLLTTKKLYLNYLKILIIITEKRKIKYFLKMRFISKFQKYY